MLREQLGRDYDEREVVSFSRLSWRSCLLICHRLPFTRF